VSAFLDHVSIGAKTYCLMAKQEASRGDLAQAPDVGVARAITQ